MKRILFFIALLFTLGASAQTYNPVNGTLSNKPYAPAQAVPTDMRSFFYDSAISTFRAYQDTMEVLSYLNLPKWRGGNFLIDVHSGGVLNADGTYTGGTIEKWWFKDGVADVNLVPFSGSGSGGGGPGISSVTAINGLSNVNDSTVKWGGNPLIENTRIRGDNFSLTIDSLKSFTIATYPSNRGLLHIDTADVYISGKGSRPASASLQLLPNNSLTYGGTSLGTARLIGTTGATAQIVEVNGSAISFVHSGAAQPAKVMLKYSDSLVVDSITNIAVWDSDTLKSADVSEIIAGGIDSIFITQTDSIFIISGNDTIFVGILDNIRDTADLVQGYGIYINNADSTYSPNGFDVLIAVDTTRIATKTEINIITNSDTAVFIVDSIANAPTGSEPPNTKYLVGTSPTGVFAGHANDIAELIGAVWTFTDPVAQQQLIVDNAITYASYQYDGAVWNQTTVLWRVNGNTALGQTAFLGKISKERMPFRSWNKEFMYGDTTRDVYLPKFVGTPTGNYLKFDPLGKIDTGFFRPLIAGTGISITTGPVGDTIKSSGTGGGSANRVAYWSDANTVDDFTSIVADNTNTRIGFGSTPTHTLILDSLRSQGTVSVNTSTGTGGIMLYRSVDQTTNYERLHIFSDGTGNKFHITAESAGTGTKRPIYFNGNAASIDASGNIVSSATVQGTTVTGTTALFTTMRSDVYNPQSGSGGTVKINQLGIPTTTSSGSLPAVEIGPSMNPQTGNTYTGATVRIDPFYGAFAATDLPVLDVGSNTAIAGGGTYTRVFDIRRNGTVTISRPLATSGSTPSNTPGTGAGTSPTISITGNDAAGKISIATGTSPTASGDIVTITFATALTNTPKAITLTQRNEAAATEFTKFYIDDASIGTSSFKIKNTASALTASTTYIFSYTVTQ